MNSARPGDTKLLVFAHRAPQEEVGYSRRPQKEVHVVLTKDLHVLKAHMLTLS